MTRSPSQMPTVIKKYAEILKNLYHEEMSTTGEDDRVLLGFVAGGIARFLRKQPRRDAAERQEGFALAAQAEAVQQRCFAPPPPTGHA
jgi:hypothetical protein